MLGCDVMDFELSFIREDNTMKTNTKTKLQPPLMRGLYLYLTYWDLNYFCLSSDKQLHQSNESLEKLGFYGLISLIIGHQTPSTATQRWANNKHINGWMPVSKLKVLTMWDFKKICWCCLFVYCGVFFVVCLLKDDMAINTV